MKANVLTLSLSVLALGCSGAVAAERSESFSDIRVGYTLVDDSYEGTRDDGISATDFDEDWDESHRVFATWLWTPGMETYGGWLFGLTAVTAFRDTDSDDSDADLEYDAYALHANIGYGIPIGESFQIELVPFIGVGSARLKRVLPGGTSTSDNETLIEYGANLNGVFVIDKRFLIGAQVGYLISDTSYEFTEASGDEVDYDFQQGNILYSAFLGYRF